LRAAVAAPSARHVLPWRFVIVESEAKLRDLSERVFDNYSIPSERLAKLKLEGKTVFHDAPLVIIIACEDAHVKWAKEDCALAAENAFLAARALGVGSCFIGMANALNEEPEDLRAAGVPAGCKVYAVLAFGFPKGGKWPKGERRKIEVVKRFK
jgi:nitroreductase